MSLPDTCKQEYWKEGYDTVNSYESAWKTKENHFPKLWTILRAVILLYVYNNSSPEVKPRFDGKGCFSIRTSCLLTFVVIKHPAGPGFESHLLPFRSLYIFVLFTMP